MCLVVDTNCIALVFNKANSEHPKFAPILKWLFQGNGRMIYGGKKYKSELAQMHRYGGILAELRRKGRLVEMPGSDVDAAAVKLKKKIPSKNFNDEHIVALVILSRCCIVCSNDRASYQFLQRRDLYPKGMKPPKIYNQSRHHKLCCDRHVVDVCR